MVSKTAQYSLAVSASRGCLAVSAPTRSGTRAARTASKQKQRQGKVVLLQDGQAVGSRKCEVSTSAPARRYHYGFSAALLPAGNALVTIGHNIGHNGGLPAFSWAAASLIPPMLDSDLCFAGFVLFLLIAALLFPGGPGTPRRLRVQT